MAVFVFQYPNPSNPDTLHSQKEFEDLREDFRIKESSYKASLNEVETELDVLKKDMYLIEHRDRLLADVQQRALKELAHADSKIRMSPRIAIWRERAQRERQNYISPVEARSLLEKGSQGKKELELTSNLARSTGRQGPQTGWN